LTSSADAGKVWRGVAAALEQSRIAHYLVSLGLVNRRSVLAEDLVVADVSRRNCVFLVTTSGGPALVVKQGGPSTAATVAREAAVLRALAGSPLVPELVHFDPRSARLVLRSPAGGRDFDEAHRRRAPLLLARSLGRALAELGGAAVDVAPLPAGAARLWGLTLAEPTVERLQGMSSAGRELVARVQADDALCRALAGVREELEPARFVHGDIRWPNCLALGRSRVLVIDWEHAGPGPAGLDVAAALAEYLRRWIASVPSIQPSMDWAQVEASARMPLPSLLPAIGALWDAYRAVSPAAIVAVVQLAAVRLLETAVEYAAGLAALSGHVLALAQLAANMLRAPGLIGWNTLGLRQ
jgi:aminoglycoside phosphotransferase (APT) family kinase protein